MRESKIKEIACRDIGRDAFTEYTSFAVNSPDKLIEAARKTLASVPPIFGSCVMISAGFVAALKSYYSIPAIAVIGDLYINGTPVFKCKKNIPTPSRDNPTIREHWDGHCWVEVGGYICDLSLFRSAYALKGPSLLKNFIINNFGEGKGAILLPLNNLPQGMDFIPKYVLNESQISGILSGLAEQSTTGRPQENITL